MSVTEKPFRSIAAHSQTDESDLWAHRDTDPRAREALATRYLSLARHFAFRYRTEHEPVEDLIQVASVALMNAIDRFDPDMGSTFPSFARPTITGELKRYFRDRVWLVRIPRNLQEDLAESQAAETELTASLKREPTLEEVAAYAGLSKNAVEASKVARSERLVDSLDRSVGPDTSIEQMEVIGDEDPAFDLVSDRIELRGKMGGLTADERRVLRFRFVDDMIQGDIAVRMGCSQMHISRVIRRALAKLGPPEADLSDEPADVVDNS